VLIKMLVASEPGEIQLLPALPEAWPSGTIEGVLCRGGIEIRRLHWENGTILLTLVSSRQQQITLRAPSAIEAIAVMEGEASVQETDREESRRLSLPAGQEITLELTLSKF